MLNYSVHIQAQKLPWLVFLHGAGGNLNSWKYQVPHFERHYNLLLLDLRDHGLSKNMTPAFERYTFDIIVDDILAVLKKQHIQKAHFVTLSFGSVLLQALHLRQPDLIDKAVLAGGIFKANFLIRIFVRLADFLNFFLSYRQMYRLFSYLLMPRRRHQFSRKLYQKHAEILNSTEYLKWLGLYAQFFDLLQQFYYQDLGFKSLVVMGQHDYVFLDSAKQFVARQSQAQLFIMGAAGHICNIDQPASFNTVTLRFLQDREPNPTLLHSESTR